MSVAVRKPDGTMEIILDSGFSFSLPISDYRDIRNTFRSDRYLLDDMVISPTAVIDYLEERNPLLLEAEIQIENDKVRRKMQNAAYDMAKWAVPFSMIIIAGVIAWKMLTSGDAGGAAQAVNAASNSVAPVVIR